MNPNIDLEALEKERQEITDFLSQPNAYADANFAAKNRRLQELEELITLGKKRIQLQNDIKEAEAVRFFVKARQMGVYLPDSKRVIANQ